GGPGRQGDGQGEDHDRSGDEDTAAVVHRLFPRERTATGRRQIFAVIDSSSGAMAAMVIVSPRHNNSVSTRPIRRSLISVISIPSIGFIGPPGARLVIARRWGVIANGLPRLGAGDLAAQVPGNSSPMGRPPRDWRNGTRPARGDSPGSPF